MSECAIEWDAQPCKDSAGGCANGWRRGGREDNIDDRTVRTLLVAHW